MSIVKKISSIDENWRNHRDIAELLEIADKATSQFLVGNDAASQREYEDQLRIHFEAIRARRQAEDANERVVS